jgi:hypothetical protein
MYLTEKGYIDIEDSDLTNLNILFGGRGIGKTFSILKHRIENALNSDDNKFIWMRDSQEVIKKIAAGNSLASPICSVCPKLPEITIERTSGNYCFIADAKTDNYKVLGYLMGLSTFHNARGISYEDVTNITWDEFIPEEGTIVKKNQGAIFLNAYESVNRNRELEGFPPVQIIFLSNTNDIYSDVLEDLGVSKLIEDMMYNEMPSYKDPDIWIEFLSSDKFYEQKKNTFIYRINKNDKFKNMALDNKFNNNLALVKKTVDFKGSTGLLTVAGKYTLIQLADGSLYYKLGCWKNLINYDMDNDQEALLYRLLFNDKLRLKYIAGQMFFDSIYTQRKMLEYAKI